MSIPKNILSVSGTQILKNNNPIQLKGINLGGWLLMEGYILHALNVAEQTFKKNFTAQLGEEALGEFEKVFRTNFITEKDFERIAKMGFNCIRVPFNCRLIEPSPHHYSEVGVSYLKQVLQWAAKYQLWVILDLHAAPGAQNHDWHSDSLGMADLWKHKELQERTAALWRFLADRFKEEEWLAGYDILNEAVINDPQLLNHFYHRVIKAIREVDQKHIIFVEGNTWAQDLECLDIFQDNNLSLSIHYYQPLDFTFNFVHHLRYPLKSGKEVFNHKAIAAVMERYARLAEKRKLPIFVGEFGVNYRQGIYGEDKWLDDVLHRFHRLGFHWAYWTYKAVKNAYFPDGLFSFMGNPPWVHRQGPRLGWENYADCWPKQQKEMINSWRSESYQENKEITAVLKNYLHPRHFR